MFAHNRFEVGIGNKFVVQYFAEKLGMAGKIHFLEPKVHQGDLYLAFSKKGKAQAMITHFSAALVEFRKTRKYRELLMKHGL